jgi:hypothetical protein
MQSHPGAARYWHDSGEPITAGHVRSLGGSGQGDTALEMTLLALKGPSAYTCQCLLIGHDQTCRGRTLTAEFDPQETCCRRGTRMRPYADAATNCLRGPVEGRAISRSWW